MVEAGLVQVAALYTYKEAVLQAVVAVERDRLLEFVFDLDHLVDFLALARSKKEQNLLTRVASV